jgi:hypothetical protein
MREFRSYGSVRGALSNERPYRERNSMNSESVGLHDSGGMNYATVMLDHHAIESKRLNCSIPGLLATVHTYPLREN